MRSFLSKAARDPTTTCFGFGLEVYHVEWLAGAQPESTPLTNGVSMNTVMATQLLPRLVDDGTPHCHRLGLTLHEALVVSIRDETNVHTLVLESDR